MKLPQIFFYDKSGQIIQLLKQQISNKTITEIPFDKFPTLDSAVHAFAIDSVVSPGNSYGTLGGGFDLVINNYYKQKGIKDPTKVLQSNLKGGYNPVGNTRIVSFSTNVPKLIHIPTMRTPQKCPPDVPIVFNCMWSMLSEIDDFNSKNNSELQVKRILLTGLGTGYGGISECTCAKQISLALELWQNPVNTTIMEQKIQQSL